MKVKLKLESMGHRETYLVKPQLVEILRWTLQICEKLDFDNEADVTRVTQLLIEDLALSSEKSAKSPVEASKK